MAPEAMGPLVVGFILVLLSRLYGAQQQVSEIPLNGKRQESSVGERLNTLTEAWFSLAATKLKKHFETFATFQAKVCFYSSQITKNFEVHLKLNSD